MSASWALLAAALLAAAGRGLHWLTPAAAVAATGVGTAVLAGGGWAAALPLGVFFVSGSLLTRRDGGEGRPRTARQVLANGWTAAAGALVIPWAPEPGWAMLAGGLAAAQADTWATEIGTRAGRHTVLITTGRPVAPGTSGGVSGVGSLGALAGAGLLAVSLLPAGGPSLLAPALGGGVAGALSDSVLGAAVQGRFACVRCGAQTEQRMHCGTHGECVQGWPWADNDTVNLLGTGAGALAGLALAWALP